jgi:hypothetical protein
MKQRIQNVLEMVIILAFGLLHPILAEAWYRINFWLAQAVMLAVVFLLGWLEQRTPEGREPGLFKPIPSRKL